MCQGGPCPPTCPGPACPGRADVHTGRRTAGQPQDDQDGRVRRASHPLITHPVHTPAPTKGAGRAPTPVSTRRAHPIIYATGARCRQGRRSCNCPRGACSCGQGAGGCPIPAHIAARPIAASRGPSWRHRAGSRTVEWLLYVMAQGAVRSGPCQCLTKSRSSRSQPRWPPREPYSSPPASGARPRCRPAACARIS